MQTLPPGSPPSALCAGARAEDFRATLEGAVARILEAHRGEVAELQRQLRAGGQPPPGDAGRQPLPPPPGARECEPPGPRDPSESWARQCSVESTGVRVPVPVQQPAVICQNSEDSAPEPTVVKPVEPKHGWVEPRDATGRAKEICVVPAASLAGGESERLTGPQWQWKHRQGWKNYEQTVSSKIEATFQRGQPKARLKAGKKGSSPMEIFFADMVQHDASTGNTRDVRRVGTNLWWQRVKRHALSYYYAWDTGLPRTETLEDAKARKKLIEMDGIGAIGTTRDPMLNFYKPSGPFADIARSRLFTGFATFLVALNTVWIAIELDINDGSGPKIGFQVVENMFCALFSAEIAIRFAAYRRKVLCLRDSWFCFDSMLVLPMVVDTWLLPLAGILAGHERGSSLRGDLTVLRVARLLRLTRMYRLLKSMPTMMTLLRGISTSIKPVSIAICLLMIIIYIFSIIFRSLVDEGSFLEREYFPSLTYAMLFLLMHGTFLDSVGSKGFEILEGGIHLYFCFLICVFLTSFLMLNMLIGVVCEMVSTVKHGEQEMLAKVSLRGSLYDIMEVYDSDGTGALNQSEFDLFIRNVEVMQALHQFDVDIKGLGTLGEMVFSHASQEARAEDVELAFDDIMSLAVRLKGTSACRVEDIVKLREFTKHRLITLEEHLMSNTRMLEENVGSMSPRSFGRPA